ncbi:MAG: sigma-70 family RNA polymerase sigma factor [Betaproteobacteria bacterium]|nr:sigma-70 family RNA polymerase sigma factor [Betaproteobacteria bacterium]MDE2424034.1 sigma-70 family RNA polymerase sigma factor [Betaproteobacteria bacterium]
MTITEDAFFDQPHLIEPIRQTMIKFAQLQLGDKHAAEDVVQEAMLGALKNKAQFQGESAFKTWIFAILKNKIIDLIRQRSKSIAISAFSEDDNANLDELFDQQGHWQVDEKPMPWGNPEQTAMDKEFWLVLDLCLENLPKKQAQLFMMREYLGLEVKDIEASMGLTMTNINVLLYRARLRLRECLENNWFKQGGL